MLRMVIVPADVTIDTNNISCVLTLFCCHELDRRHLLMRVTAQVFFGLSQCAVGNKGYHLWLACVLPRKSL